MQGQLQDVQQTKASSLAFAAILGDGSAVTWAPPDYGGDSSAVQDQMKNVQQVQASELAFAAVLLDGFVVTWGKPDGGGDSSAVQDQRRTCSKKARRQPAKHSTGAASFPDVPCVAVAACDMQLHLSRVTLCILCILWVIGVTSRM